MGSLSIGHWLIILIVVILAIGAHKLGFVDRDVDMAMRNFKKVMNGGDWSKIAGALLVVLLLIVVAQMLAAR